MRKLKAFCVGLLLFFGACNIGCAGMQMPLDSMNPEAARAKSALDKVADRLDDRLTVARGAYAVADGGLNFACNLGMSGKICTNARKVSEYADGLLKGADDAIDLYRETGQHFDAAMKKLEDAERRVVELRALVESLKRSLVYGFDGGVIGEAA